MVEPLESGRGAREPLGGSSMAKQVAGDGSPVFGAEACELRVAEILGEPRGAKL